MNLKKILTKEVIALELKSESKNDIITELVDILYKAGKISDREPVIEAVLKRESQMSTGIQAGVAIPHAKCPEVSELVSSIAVCKEGRDFQALDGKPSQIFVLTLSPANKSGPHVQYLAEISRLLTQEAVREAILASDSPESVLHHFLQ